MDPPRRFAAPLPASEAELEAGEAPAWTLAEAGAVLAQQAPDDAALVREAVAWDALHIPAHGAAPRPEVHHFTRDWWSWRADDGRPAPRALAVRRHAPPWASAERAAWFDTFVAQGWAKLARVHLEPV